MRVLLLQEQRFSAWQGLVGNAGKSPSLLFGMQLRFRRDDDVRQMHPWRKAYNCCTVEKSVNNQSNERKLIAKPKI
jgi:hypothetical protein